MGRFHFLELHDQTWCPVAIRDGCTDYLAFLGNLSDLPYRAFVRRLAVGLRQTGDRMLLDLCSGGGGPTRRVQSMLARVEQLGVKVTLSDWFPNREAFEAMCEPDVVQAEFDPVDAMDVPARLVGFRTLNNAFHHFRPQQARGILADAVRKKQGIAVLELVRRHPLNLMSILLIPLAAWAVAPAVRPFRWNRLLFTYVFPVIPLVLGLDGLVSCLRVYSPTELRALVEGIEAHESFVWDIGIAWPGVTYLIGYPKADPLISTS